MSAVGSGLATGLELRRRWQELADRHGLTINHNGLPALTGFAFQSSQALAYKTLISQEMLKRGCWRLPAVMSAWPLSDP